MQLKDFVAEKLKEIVDGVVEAQGYYEDKGGSVASGLQYAGAAASQVGYKSSATGDPVQIVEFDVAVTAAEGTDTKGGGPGVDHALGW